MTEIERKRVEVATDALAQILSGKANPSSGAFLRLKRYDETLSINDKDCSCHIQLNDYLKKDGTTCNVCIKGGLLLSLVMKENHFSTFDTKLCGEPEAYDNLIKSRLTCFSSEQLDLMEVAFEGRTYDYNEAAANSEYQNAITFYNKHYYPKGRMIAILGNLIANHGKFRP